MSDEERGDFTATFTWNGKPQRVIYTFCTRKEVLRQLRNEWPGFDEMSLELKE